MVENEAKEKISEIQAKYAKHVNPENRVKITKEFYKNKGYTEEEIKQKCSTPTQIEFWTNKGLTSDEAKTKISEHQKIATKNIYYDERLLPSNIEYWINKGLSYEAATEKIKERQSTFSLEKCIEKHGEEKGRERWIQRQEKWLKNYKKNNYSKISQKLFWETYNNLDEHYKKSKNIYFATLNQTTKKQEIENRNNEFRLKLNKSFILPDFFVLEDKKIIEFDGVYYHRNNPENKKRELRRDKNIIDSGYEVYHVSEEDFIVDKSGTINKCLEFLQLNKKD